MGVFGLGTWKCRGLRVASWTSESKKWEHWVNHLILYRSMRHISVWKNLLDQPMRKIRIKTEDFVFEFHKIKLA